MALPSKFAGRLFAGIALGMLVYIGMAVWADVGAVGATFAALPLWVIPAACGLSFLNYAIRFQKWRRYCKLLEIDLETRTSFLIYLSGLALSVTPGKMGEVFKSWLVRKVTGVRIHHSAPIVVAERFTDLLGYLILVAIGGLRSAPEYAWMFWAMLAACVVLLLLSGSDVFARWIVAMSRHVPRIGSRLAPRIEVAFQSTRILLAPREILMPTLVSVIGWGLECTGFWLIANAVVPGGITYLAALFAWAFSAVAGAVLIIFPGGLGVTELLIGKLVRPRFQPVLAARLGVGVDAALDVARQKATGAVIVARLCTLWFAVLVGIVALALFTKRFGAVEETPDPEPEPGSAA